MKSFSYFITGCAHDLYPVETHFSLFYLQDGTIAELPHQYPFVGPWGESAVDSISLRESLPVPQSFEVAYLSIVEGRFYFTSVPINPQVMERVMEQIDAPQPFSIKVGMAPYGRVALWIGGRTKQILLGWLSGGEVNVGMQDFLPNQSEMSINDYCNTYINSDAAVHKNLKKHGLPPRDLFDNYMKQFTYRYQVEFGHWDEEHQKWEAYSEEEKEQKPELDYIEESLYDGTHDKLHDGGLMRYHEAGKPQKMAVQWHIGKKEWTAYFWFEDEEIRTVFDRFYGAHPETKTDFMIRIDTEKKIFELALYRYGLEEPQVISESAYQLIVFKNRFEYFRSDNYNQPKGAWIW